MVPRIGGLLTYQINELGEKAKEGMSEPLNGSIRAVFKRDTEGALHAVYNEAVALRLAMALTVPVAVGVLVSSPVGLMFASIETATAGVPLPPVRYQRRALLIQSYPEDCAALLAFDLWIANYDREGNLTANLSANRKVIPIFAGFDHANSLLGCAGEPRVSIAALRTPELIVEYHFLADAAEPDRVRKWIGRIQSLSPDLVERCCKLGAVVNGVTPAVQLELAEAMVQRLGRLHELYEQLRGGR